MKFSKSNKILINVIFILVIVFFLKSLFAFPKETFAQKNYAKYKVIQFKDSIEQIEKDLNQYANDGWKLYYIMYYGGFGPSVPIAVLER